MSNTIFEAVKQYHNELSNYVIDIGTRDLKTSNVYPYAMQGYKTLVVEPNPKQIPIILKEMKEVNKDIILSENAIFDHDGEVQFISVDQPNLIGHSRIPNNNFDRLKGCSTKNVTKNMVKCITLKTLLDQNPQFINSDIISIDVEGNDEIILKQIMDIKEFRPMFIFVETMFDKKRMETQNSIVQESYDVFGLFDNNQNTLYKRK